MNKVLSNILYSPFIVVYAICIWGLLGDKQDFAPFLDAAFFLLLYYAILLFLASFIKKLRLSIWRALGMIGLHLFLFYLVSNFVYN